MRICLEALVVRQVDAGPAFTGFNSVAMDRRLGVLTGFPQITCPCCLRYGAGNAFNQSCFVPNPTLQTKKY
jgi:hypothetical protein